MMLDELQGTMGIEFVFESGTYHFYPDYAVEKTLYISNHDEDVPKRIAFDFSGWRKVRSGRGSGLSVSHGYFAVSPGQVP